MSVIEQVVALHAAGLVSGATVAKYYRLDKACRNWAANEIAAALGPFGISLDEFVRRYQIELAAVQAEREQTE
jgi:hypothetical protein